MNLGTVTHVRRMSRSINNLSVYLLSRFISESKSHLSITMPGLLAL